MTFFSSWNVIYLYVLWAGSGVFWVSSSPETPLLCVDCTFADSAPDTMATEVVYSVFVGGPPDNTFRIAASQVRVAQKLCTGSNIWFRLFFSDIKGKDLN